LPVRAPEVGGRRQSAWLYNEKVEDYFNLFNYDTPQIATGFKESK